MRPDVFDATEAQAKVGGDPNHRICLALGRQRCDSLTSHREQIVAATVRGAEARPPGRAFSLSAGPLASPVTLSHQHAPPSRPPVVGLDKSRIARPLHVGQYLTAIHKPPFVDNPNQIAYMVRHTEKELWYGTPEESKLSQCSAGPSS